MALRMEVLGNGNVMIWNDAQVGGSIQIYTHEEWNAFVQGVRNNEFDLEVIRADRESA